MAENRIFLITTGPDREEALRKRLALASQTNIVGQFRPGETTAEFEALLRAGRPEILIVDCLVSQERALEAAIRARQAVPLCVQMILMTAKDFDFLQSAVRGGVDFTLVEPVDMADALRQAQVALANKLRAAGGGGEPGGQPSALPGVVPVASVTMDGALKADPTVSGGARTLAFVSSKDGEGKSTVALNLALTLASKFGKKAIYVDLAETLSETAMMLDRKPPGSYLNLLALHGGAYTHDGIKRFSIDYYGDGKALAICGNAGIVPPKVDRDALDLLVRFLKTQCEFLILDCPVHFCDNLKIGLKLADWHVVVVQNTLSSLRNTRLYLAELRRLEYPAHQVRVVLNRVSKTAGLSREDIEANLSEYQLACSVVSNGAVAIEAANLGTPVVVHAPDSDIAECIHNLAKSLLGIETSDIASESGLKVSSLSNLFGLLGG